MNAVSYFPILIIILLLLSSCDNRKVVDIYSISEVASNYLKKTYKLKNTFYYMHNEPRTKCINRPCTLIAPIALRKERNNCSGCLSVDRLDTKIEISTLLKGESLTVIKAYELEHTSFLYRMFNGKHNLLILKDEKGIISEMSESTFEFEIVNGIGNTKKRSKEKEKIVTFLENGRGHKEWHCLTNPSINRYRENKKSNYTLKQKEQFYTKFGPFIELK